MSLMNVKLTMKYFKLSIFNFFKKIKAFYKGFQSDYIRQIIIILNL